MTILVGWIFPLVAIACGVVVFFSLIPFVRRVSRDARPGQDHDD
jgi:hypothetical protein